MAYIIIYFQVEKPEKDGSLYMPSDYVIGERILEYIFPSLNSGWMCVNTRASLDYDDCGKKEKISYAKINIKIERDEFPEEICENAKNKFMNMPKSACVTDCVYSYFPVDIELSHYYEEIKEPSDDEY